MVKLSFPSLKHVVLNIKAPVKIVSLDIRAVNVLIRLHAFPSFIFSHAFLFTSSFNMIFLIML